ncbi:MAG: sulfatase [Pirellulaceae bacterium]
MQQAMRLLAGVFCTLLAFAGLPAAAAERPNFVFIHTDDQRWDALGVVQREQGTTARFPWFETPHLDRLAAEGIRFRNAFVVNSLCAPSRAAFLTGRYNHQNGIANNRTPFPIDATTWASLLQKAGYHTGYVGKWHMGQQAGQRPGFDYSASFVGQGRYENCPFQIDGQATPTTGWVDDVSTDFAIEFLKSHRGQPFALALGLKAAHGPFQPPQRLAEKYAGQVARPTPNTEVDAIYSGKFDGGRPQKKKSTAKKRKAGLQDGANKLRGYFGCLSAVDENVGRVLAALDELKLTENTVVIFSSDNGFYLGEHNLGDKRSAYDESLRIPLLVRWPQLGEQGRGKSIDKMALNIDLAPTLLDLAGVDVPAEMQGRSWRPLLAGDPETASWRKAFFYEYFFERNFAIPTVLAVRTETAKLIKYPGHDDWTELFDLAADPYETKNLATSPAGKDLRTSLQAEFDRQAKAVGFKIPDYADPLPPRSE